MTRRFFSGTSVEQAVLLAARHYEIDPSEVAFQEVDKRHGFLRIRRKVIVEVDPENPRRSRADEPRAVAPDSAPSTPAPGAPPDAHRPSPRSPSSPPPTPRDEARNKAAVAAAEATTTEPPATSPRHAAAAGPGRPRAAEADTRRPSGHSRDGRHLVGLPEGPRPVTERFPPAEGSMALAAEKAVTVVLELLEMEAEIDVRQGEGQLEIELTTDETERLLSDDGRILGSMQHLIPRLIRGFVGESIPCRIDCDNFLLIHEERLRDLAQRSADEARRQGRVSVLRPMPPEERRIVHLALADDSAVVTESVGSGFFKRVRIRPA